MRGRRVLKRALFFSSAVSIFFLSLFLPSEVKAEGDLSRPVIYQKYHISGLIDFTYEDYSLVNTDHGLRTENRTVVFQQRYKLGVDGYIVHPKLALYSAQISYWRANIYQKEPVNANGSEDEIGYNFYVRLLPQRPYSLDIYATRATGTISDGVSSYDITTNTYGLILRLSLKEILSSKGKPRKEGNGNGNGNGGLASALPFVTLRYSHWDFDAEKGFGKSETNLFGVDLGGYVKPIRTRYALVYEFQTYSSPTRNYDAQYLRANTDTSFGARNQFSTAFQYSKIDISTLTNFTANLDLVHSDRFGQSYYYNYSSVDAGSSSTVTHNVQGIWDYRFAERFFARGTAFYSLTSTDGEKEDTYGAGATVRYGKRLTNYLDFTSAYRFAYRTMWSAGNFYENSMELGLRTTRLKWGALYANYSYTQQNSSELGNLYEHIARVGARGRGPGRAYWNVEAEYVNLNNELGGVSAILPGGPDEMRIAGPQKIDYYSFTAEGGYPVGRRGLLSAMGNYTTGTADGQALERYYYEGRLTYLLLRNLSVVGWWREGWDKLAESSFNRKVRVLEGRLYYRLRRLFFSLEYRNWRTEQGPLSTEENRFYLRLTRPI